MPPEMLDAWAAPPDWLPLSEATRWLAHRFKTEPDEQFVMALISAIRSHEVRYRIAIEPRRYSRHPNLPKGFTAGRDGPAVVVEDWDAVSVDWRSGTVAGWPDDGDGIARHAIELWWPRLESWARPEMLHLSLTREIERKRKRKEAKPALLPSVNLEFAIQTIMQRTGRTEGPATTLLLKALGDGEIRAWGGDQSVPDMWHANIWADAVIDLHSFKAKGHSGLCLRGDIHHLHYPRLEAVDFNSWLGLQPSVSPPHEPQTDTTYQTGMAGRPTSKRLIAAELERRRRSEKVLLTQSKESEALAEWLAREHPEASLPTAKAIGDALRNEIRQAVGEAKEREKAENQKVR